MASIKILLRNKPNKEGQYPVVLKVIKDRKIKVITLGITCLEKDWDKANAKFKKSQPNYMQRNRALLKKKEQALKIIDDFFLEGVDFTLTQFEAKFRGKSSSNITVIEFWNERLSDLSKAGKTGTARIEKYVKNSLFKYAKNKSLHFRDITPVFLEKFEIHLRSNNNDDGSIGVRMRHIKAMFNSAIKQGVVDEKYYPFKVYKTAKLKSKGIKRALSRKEMKLMESVDTIKNPNLLDAKNYMVFSYYSGGMNFIDMMKLKWENIQEDRIVYTRSKTKGNFTVKMLEPVKKVVEYYKAQNRPTDYVFPILLSNDLSPIQIEYRKNKTLRAFNKKLKEIASIQGVKKNVTSYVIRHSFATNLKYAGISSDLISQTMGHHDVSVTNAYLKEFENDAIDNAMNKLFEEPRLRYAS